MMSDGLRDRIGLVALALAWGGGCGDEVPTPMQACADLAGAHCSKLKACDAMLFQVVFRDDADCASGLSSQCSRAIAAPDAKTTAAETAACAHALPTASCDQFVADDIEACRTSPGARPAGAPCGGWSQCTSHSCTFISSEGCGRCRSAGAVDGACASATDCRGALECKDGRCRNVKGLGSSCAVTSDCPGFLACIDRRCARVFPPPNGLEAVLAGPGDRCGAQAGGVVALCRGGLTCSGGTCMPSLVVGATCSPSGVACDSPSYCLVGTCQVPDPLLCKDDGTRPPPSEPSGGGGGSISCSGNCSCVCSGGRFLTGLIGGACTCDEACRRTGNGSGVSGSCS